MPTGKYERKPITHCRRNHEFHPENTYYATDGRRRCLTCVRSRKREYRKSDHGRRVNRENWLRTNYGLSLQSYDKMLADQNGVCAICKEEPGTHWLVVDHNHKTGKIRGLLCWRCNGQGLGGFKDSHEIVESAHCYMEEDRGYFAVPNAEILQALYSPSSTTGLP